MLVVSSRKTGTTKLIQAQSILTHVLSTILGIYTEKKTNNKKEWHKNTSKIISYSTVDPQPIF